jgi:hypothetical protein
MTHNCETPGRTCLDRVATGCAPNVTRSHNRQRTRAPTPTAGHWEQLSAFGRNAVRFQAKRVAGITEMHTEARPFRSLIAYDH